MTTPPSDFARAQLALAVFAVDPGGLKGLIVRARAGPVRQAFEALFTAVPGPHRRIHPGLTDDQLYGSINVAASLSGGRLVRDVGLCESASLLVLPMAERTPPQLAARLSQLLDAGLDHGLILLDESTEDEPGLPAGLRDRLAFSVTLEGLRHDEAQIPFPAAADLDAARGRLHTVSIRPEDADRLTLLAARFGIASLRAPLLALRTARALAALEGRRSISDDDIQTAAELVYPARATLLPAEQESQPPHSEPPTPNTHNEGDSEAGSGIPDDALIAAVAARLPPGLLDRLEHRAARTTFPSGSGAGARRKANRRGRPLPSRCGRPDTGARIDIVATLRTAAPWQRIRRAALLNRTGPIILPQDICLRRYEDRSDRLLIFAVDASGSAAMARLGEAKGSVELLLAQAYARRDQVALIAFRGRDATLLLPPTRSLVQAKRQLAALPGGGGTPLAAALSTALALMLRTRAQGLTPALALLTDGRANVALDGSGNRAQASADALKIARALSATGLPGLLIDTALRESSDTRTLAAALGAHHILLPHADASRIARAVTKTLSD